MRTKMKPQPDKQKGSSEDPLVNKRKWHSGQEDPQISAFIRDADHTDIDHSPADLMTLSNHKEYHY